MSTCTSIAAGQNDRQSTVLEPFAARSLRVKDAAARHGVSTSYLWKLAKSGRLHPRRVSYRCTLWDVAELDRVLGGTVE